MIVQTRKETLSDGSIVFNVFMHSGDIDGGKTQVTFACCDSAHADELKRQIDRCAWIEEGRAGA